MATLTALLRLPSILAVITNIPQSLSLGLVAIYSVGTLISRGNKQVSKCVYLMPFESSIVAAMTKVLQSLSLGSAALYSVGTLIGHGYKEVNKCVYFMLRSVVKKRKNHAFKSFTMVPCYFRSLTTLFNSFIRIKSLKKKNIVDSADFIIVIASLFSVQFY